MVPSFFRLSSEIVFLSTPGKSPKEGAEFDRAKVVYANAPAKVRPLRKGTEGGADFLRGGSGGVGAVSIRSDGIALPTAQAGVFIHAGGIKGVGLSPFAERYLSGFCSLFLLDVVGIEGRLGSAEHGVDH